MAWQKFPGGSRRSKYGNKKIPFDGHLFDSKLEKEYYCQLLLDKAAGNVTNIIVHPRYKIEINGHKICSVVLDFEFLDRRKGNLRYVDVKGMYLPEAKLRHKLLAAARGIPIEVIFNDGTTEVISYAHPPGK